MSRWHRVIALMLPVTPCFLLLVSFVSPALAQLQSACGLHRSTIFFANGVLTEVGGPHEGALGNLQDVQVGLSSLLTADEFGRVDFALAYNSTSGILADLFQSAEQKLLSDYGPEWTGLLWLMLHGILPMPDYVRDALLKLAVDATQSTVVSDVDLQRHIADYNATLVNGSKVVVVAHSQGNFYANLAYPFIAATARASFGIVSVANPSLQVADGRLLYTTLDRDLVILAINASAPPPLFVGTLPPNEHSPCFLCPDDQTGHFFSTSYLRSGSASREDVVGDIVDSIRTLRSPPCCGDDQIDAGEQCDGTDSATCDGRDCVPPGQPDACTCSPCGNGALNNGEECDASVEGGDAACPGGCQTDCTCASCVTDPGLCPPPADVCTVVSCIPRDPEADANGCVVRGCEIGDGIDPCTIFACNLDNAVCEPQPKCAGQICEPTTGECSGCDLSSLVGHWQGGLTNVFGVGVFDMTLTYNEGILSGGNNIPGALPGQCVDQFSGDCAAFTFREQYYCDPNACFDLYTASLVGECMYGTVLYGNGVFGCTLSEPISDAWSACRQ